MLRLTVVLVSSLGCLIGGVGAGSAHIPSSLVMFVRGVGDVSVHAYTYLLDMLVCLSGALELQPYFICAYFSTRSSLVDFMCASDLIVGVGTK